jgi:predicted  nucleic acid-binding Zn-ribbon protein
VEERGVRVAHKQKYTRGAVGHMLGHYDRSKAVPELKASVNTVLNYNLAYNDQPKNQLDFLHQRLSEIKVHNRKDVNVMVDWVVTIPQSLNDKGLENERRFFEEAHKFLNNRYGKENVISAYVHMDETTPHMHYAFVPVVEDIKNGGYKLSAKEAVTREDLRTFHKDLSDHMERVFGRDIGILNEATKEGNKSIEELKRGTAQEELQKATLKTQEMLSNARKLEKAMEVARKQKRGLESEIEGLEKQFEGAKLQFNEILSMQPQKTLTGAIKGISLEDINNLKTTAMMAARAIAENKDLRNEVQHLKEVVENLKSKIPSIMDKVKESKEKAALLEKAQAFDRLPDEIKKQAFPDKEKIQTKNKWRNR